MIWTLRWVCASGKPEDLQKTDEIACEVLEEIMKNSYIKKRFSNKCMITLLGLKERKKINW
ncbi:MAG: hypothetical protein U0T78_02365 [Cloacibacterium normanense]